MEQSDQSTIQKIAWFQHIRSEIPNQQLACELAKFKDENGINEIATGLSHREKNVRSDCLKVLYEIGYMDPALIAPFVHQFLQLFRSKDNRMVWGAMIALATISRLRPAEIWADINFLIGIFNKGTVITRVWGIRLFAGLAAENNAYAQVLFPVMLHTLETCIPRDVPTHVESMLPAINPGNSELILQLLKARAAEFSATQQTRIRKLEKQIRSFENR